MNFKDRIQCENHLLLLSAMLQTNNNLENEKQLRRRSSQDQPDVPEKQLTIKINESKKSKRCFGKVQAYAANTHSGLLRNYNEDRVSIIMQVEQPASKQGIAAATGRPWPRISFFAVYDGHGGHACSDFLRDNLHHYIVRDENFPENPIKAIKRGISEAEFAFIQYAERAQDKSGSCAIIVMIIEDVAYTINIGDSRAVVSIRNGEIVEDLSHDHKPEKERARIEAAGGKVLEPVSIPTNVLFQGVQLTSPHRVYPGKLSVSRTIGDSQAKLEKYGGNPNVVICQPEISVTHITSEYDFILLASDGVFDKLSSQETCQIFNNSFPEEFSDLHTEVGKAVDCIMTETFARSSLDNVSVLAIALENLLSRRRPILVVEPTQQTTSTKPLQRSISSIVSKNQPVGQTKPGNNIIKPKYQLSPSRIGIHPMKENITNNNNNSAARPFATMTELKLPLYPSNNQLKQINQQQTENQPAAGKSIPNIQPEDTEKRNERKSSVGTLQSRPNKSTYLSTFNTPQQQQQQQQQQHQSFLRSSMISSKEHKRSSPQRLSFDFHVKFHQQILQVHQQQIQQQQKQKLESNQQQQQQHSDQSNEETRSSITRLSSVSVSPVIQPSANRKIDICPISHNSSSTATTTMANTTTISSAQNNNQKNRTATSQSPRKLLKRRTSINPTFPVVAASSASKSTVRHSAV